MTSAFFHIEMLVLGAGVGLTSAALGLGGGVLMVPAFLEFVPDINPHTAKGTSLFIIIFVASLNSWRLNRRVSRKGWGLSALIAAGSIVGSVLGVWITSLVSAKTVLWCFVAVMGALGVRTFLIEPRDVSEEMLGEHRVFALFIGLTTGLVAGATGIGGGAVLVPLALIAGITTNNRVVALANMVMVPTSIAGTLAHLAAPQTADLPWTYGQVCFGLAPLVFLGSQLAAPFGERLNHKLTLPQRKVIMGVVLMIIVARLVYRALA